MNFGKFAFGALILAIGVVLLAVRVGFAHPDTPFILLRYWPILLIAFGLAFLAGAIKNPMLGCFAILLILGGTAFGMYWMYHMEKQGKLTHAVSSLDLGKSNLASLLLRVTTFGGSFDLDSSPSKTVTLARHDAAADSSVGYRFDVGGGKGVLVWPRAGGAFSLSMPGSKLEVRAPSSLPLGLRWSGRMATIHANLTRLNPTRCDLHEIFSTARIDLGNAGRPEEIRVWGLLSELRVRIPADCPVRVTSKSPFVLRSFPSDFEQHALGRNAKERVDAGEGRGRPVRIYVEGPFIHITIERMPLTAVTTPTVATQEDTEWPELEGTASRSHSPSS
jgi:hypothetical protein